MFTGHLDILFSAVPIQISWPFCILDINLFQWLQIYYPMIVFWWSQWSFNDPKVVFFFVFFCFLMQSTWSIFPFVASAFCVSFKISFLTSRSWSYSPILSSQSVTILHVGKKPTMYWLILYMVSEVEIRFYFLPREHPIDSALY